MDINPVFIYFKGDYFFRIYVLRHKHFKVRQLKQYILSKGLYHSLSKTHTHGTAIGYVILVSDRT